MVSVGYVRCLAGSFLSYTGGILVRTYNQKVDQLAVQPVTYWVIQPTNQLANEPI